MRHLSVQTCFGSRDRANEGMPGVAHSGPPAQVVGGYSSLPSACDGLTALPYLPVATIVARVQLGLLPNALVG